MDKIKGKYELILGFVTLVISLSAFKGELEKVDLDLGYTTISLASYFLFVVYGFSICLYLFIFDHLVRETKIGTWKVFEYIVWISFILFSSIFLTPIFIAINLLIVKMYSLLDQRTQKEANTFYSYISVLLSFFTIIISVYTTYKQIQEQKRIRRQLMEEQEIFELENATNLLKEGFYSHSLLESFKVLETHLFKKLTDKNYRVLKNRFNDLINLSFKNQFITADDLPLINDLRVMRNVAAHTNTEYTKQQAEFALNFVKNLLKRNG